jgi:hypothetical protein
MGTHLSQSTGRRVAIFVGWILAASVSVAAGESIRLADEGRALQPIVISKDASATTKDVANELADYLGQISGTTFKVEVGDGSRGIVLGTLAEFPDAALHKPLEMRGRYDGKEAFAIRTEPDRLRLIGRTDLAVSHAAFTLLDHLGCRWFFPAKAWEVVSKQKTISLSLEVTDRPRILARRIWYGYGSFADKGHPLGLSTQKDYDAWARHNRMASSFAVHAGHAWQSIIAANKETFAKHPEYLALVKGQRTGEQLCVSNPAVRRLAVEYALAQCAKYPDREMVSMECSDGDGQCECENCKKLGSISDRVFGLANEVAREVARRYPGKMVGCLAYNQHSEPPSFALEPNVYVQLTGGFIRGSYSHDQLLEMWPRKCHTMGFYEYFSVWLWDFDRLPGGLGANISRIQSTISRYAEIGATSIDAESGNNWGVHGRGYYVANKLMWNPDADVNAILADFYEKAFGPAAPAMKRYYERIAPDDDPLMSRQLIGSAFADVAEASQLAHDRPDVLARLDALKHYLRYNHLDWLLRHEKDKAAQKKWTVDILTFAYRTRYEYMDHWAAMKASFASAAAKQFDEPTWVRNSKDPKPWMIDAPVTQQETDRWFAEGQAYFQPEPMEELAFDYHTLVPAPQPGGKPAGMTCAFQRPQRFALQSKSGEPIELKLLAGSIAWYRDRPEAHWTLTDSAEKEVAHGTGPLDGVAHPLSIAVPSAGIYVFQCNDSGTGWRIETAPGTPIVWLPERGVRIISLGQMHELFFYVPRGTRQLEYFHSGPKHKILGPDHKVIREVEASDEIITVDVPRGDDGKCWSIAPATHHQLWLLNAPNCFAPSPDALLLPKDVALRDSLSPAR